MGLRMELIDAKALIDKPQRGGKIKPVSNQHYCCHASCPGSAYREDSIGHTGGRL